MRPKWNGRPQSKYAVVIGPPIVADTLLEELKKSSKLVMVKDTVPLVDERALVLRADKFTAEVGQNHWSLGAEHAGSALAPGGKNSPLDPVSRNPS